MKKNIIDVQTGKFQIFEHFAVTHSTTEDELCAHLKDIPFTKTMNNFIFISVQNIVIDTDYLYFVFKFKNNKVQNILFKVNNGPLPSNYKAPESDWGYSEEEMQLFDYQKNWLEQQVGTCKKFVWGKVEAMWQPLSGGAIIYLQYK